MGPFLAVTSSAAALLLVARQMLTMLENRELTGSLEETVAELREREGQLEFQAFHDPLTQLANRALFRDRLDHALEQRRDEAVSVLFVDLDDFKTVNDSLGHDAGDRLLVSVGERLRACVRVGDTVARIGGDEFAILIEGDEAGTEGPVIAQRVLSALAVPVLGGRPRPAGEREPRPGQRPLRVRRGRPAGRRPGHVRRQGQRQGARRALRAHDAHDARSTAWSWWPTCRPPSRRARCVVHLQPIVDLQHARGGGPRGAGALAAPAARAARRRTSFIALAEETGAIVPMGWWVLEQACEQAQTWPSGQVGVNLSARQLLDPAAVTTVAGILTRTGIDPRRVVLEITESVFLDTEAIGHRLHQLRALGVLLAIDDFGTGYSSLSYLTRLPVDIVKIDRSFVERLGGPPGDEVLVRAVVQLARSLGLRSVGRGRRDAGPARAAAVVRLRRRPGLPVRPPAGRAALRPRQPPVRSERRAAERRRRDARAARQPWRACRTRLGEVGAADQQVGEPGVALVVAERAAVEAADVEPGRRRHRRGGGVVPLVLAAGVGVDVGLAEHHGHGLGAGGAHRDESPAERLLDEPRLERRT